MSPRPDVLIGDACFCRGRGWMDFYLGQIVAVDEGITAAAGVNRAAGSVYDNRADERVAGEGDGALANSSVVWMP